MQWNVYLAGEIHTDWRTQIIVESEGLGLPIFFTSAVTDHEASDSAGDVLGKEVDQFWRDHKSSRVNGIRTRKLLEECDIAVIRFGDKYKQWNAAFEAGYAVALSKSLIVMHNDDNQHALKEIDAMAQAVTSNVDEVVKILNYSCNAKI